MKDSRVSICLLKPSINNPTTLDNAFNSLKTEIKPRTFGKIVEYF